MTMGVQRALQVFQTIDLRVDRNALAWLDSGAESDIKMKDILYIEPPYVVDIANGETVQKAVTMADGINKVGYSTTPYQSVVTKAYLFKSFADSDADHVDVTATVKEAIEGGNAAYGYPIIAVPIPTASSDWNIDYNPDAESGDDFALGTDATLDRLMVEYEIVKVKNTSGELVPENYTTTGYKVACVYKNVVS
jgi:hypothetical protein